MAIFNIALELFVAPLSKSLPPHYFAAQRERAKRRARPDENGGKP
jgi:hypothetical protein